MCILRDLQQRDCARKSIVTQTNNLAKKQENESVSQPTTKNSSGQTLNFQRKLLFWSNFEDNDFSVAYPNVGLKN